MWKDAQPRCNGAACPGTQLCPACAVLCIELNLVRVAPARRGTFRGISVATSNVVVADVMVNGEMCDWSFRRMTPVGSKGQRCDTSDCSRLTILSVLVHVNNEYHPMSLAQYVLITLDAENSSNYWHANTIEPP